MEQGPSSLPEPSTSARTCARESHMQVWRRLMALPALRKEKAARDMVPP